MFLDVQIVDSRENRHPRACRLRHPPGTAFKIVITPLHVAREQVKQNRRYLYCAVNCRRVREWPHQRILFRRAGADSASRIAYRLSSGSGIRMVENDCEFCASKTPDEAGRPGLSSE